jgi:hypothetical protein
VMGERDGTSEVAGTDWTGNNALLVGLASVAEGGGLRTPCSTRKVGKVSGRAGRNALRAEVYGCRFPGEQGVPLARALGLPGGR